MPARGTLEPESEATSPSTNPGLRSVPQAADPTDTGLLKKSWLKKNKLPADPWTIAQAQVVSQFPSVSYEQGQPMARKLMKIDLAERMTLQAKDIQDIFANVSDTAITQAPTTMTYAAVEKQDAALTQTLAEATDYFTSFYGDQNVGAFLSTFAISDNTSLEKTYALLKDMTGWTTPISGPAAFAADPSSEAVQGAMSAVIGSENPAETFKALSPNMQQSVYEMGQNLLEQGSRVEGSLIRANTILHTGDISSVWNADDVKNVESLMHELDTLTPGGTDNLANMKDAKAASAVARGIRSESGVTEATLNRMDGIIQVRAIENGVIVLDKEWAQQNPDKAVALRLYLESKYPDVQIDVGKQGVIGSVFESLGRTAETIAAPVGAFNRWVGEAVEVFNPFGKVDEAALRRHLDKVKADFAAGKYPKDQSDDVLHYIQNTEEDLTHDLSIGSFKANMATAVSVRMPGSGFGANYAQSIGINPGDAGYQPVVLISGLLSQIVFDSINWIFSALGVMKASQGIVRAEGLTASVDDVLAHLRESFATSGIEEPKNIQALAESLVKTSALPRARGPLQARLLGRIIRTPDEMSLTHPFQRALDTLWDLKKTHGSETFLDITAQALGRDKAMLLSTSTSRADMGNYMIRSMQGRGVDMLVVDRMKVELAAVSKELNAGRAAGRKIASLEKAVDEFGDVRPGSLEDAKLTQLEDQLVAAHNLSDNTDTVALLERKVRLKDVIEGKSWDNPRALPTPKDMRRVERLSEERTIWDEAIAQGLEHPRSRGWRKFADPLERKFPRIAHPFADSSGGKWVSLQEPKMLGAEAERLGVLDSQEYFRTMARGLGLDDAKIRAMMHPWTTGELEGNEIAQSAFWEKLWTDTIDASDLPASTKDQIRIYGVSLEGKRSGGNIMQPSVDGSVPVDVPANFDQNLINPTTGMPTGDLSGWPLNSASEVAYQGARRLPSADEWAILRRFTNRHLELMNKISGKNRIVNTDLGSLSKSLDAMTRYWKNAVMLPRLAGPLPLRIGLEQQFRMWAFGEFRFSPREWFRGWGGGIGAAAKNATNDEAILFGEVPGELLGGHVADIVRQGKLVPRSAEVKFGDDAFATAISGDLHNWFRSPEFKMWVKDNIDDPDAWLAKMRDTKVGELHRALAKKFLDRWEHLGYKTPEEGLAGAQQNLVQMIGPNSEGARLIRTALKTDGKAVYKGEIVELGSQEFADALHELKLDGKWHPTIRTVSTNSVQFLPSKHAFIRFKDFMYKWGYSKPDLAISRGPMFRTVATKEYRYMMEVGYDHNAAMLIAQRVAAKRVADVMFEIGGHTSGDHFLRNIMPFFPAWRELAKTYLIKVPVELGNLGDSASTLARLTGWGLGATKISRRAYLGLEAAAETGLLQTDSNGNLIIPLPFTDAVFQLQSMFGIFPIPIDIGRTDLTFAQRIQGLPPTLGGVASSGLGVLDEIPGLKWTKEIEAYLAPFGTDVSFMGANVDNALIAAGLGGALPWMTSTTRHMQETMEASAVMDGQRIYMRDHPWPKRPDNWDDMPQQNREKWTTEVLAPYDAAMIAFGEDYKTHAYMQKAILGLFLPFNVTQTDEAAVETAQMWELLKPFQGTEISKDLTTAAIQTFLVDHPTWESWLTSKYSDSRTSSSLDEDITDHFELIKSGEKSIKSFEDFAVWNYAKSTLNVMYRKQEAALQAIKDMPNPVLAYTTNAHGLRDGVQGAAAEINDFKAYMATTGSMIPGQTATFMTMYERDQRLKAQRSGEKDTRPRLSVTMEKLSTVNDLIKVLDKYVKLDPTAIETERYYKLQGRIADATAAMYDDKDPFYTALGHFYDTNANYWDTAGKLYDSLDASEAKHDPVIYNQIRNLAHRYNTRETFHGFELPTPEEYQFAQWTPDEQDKKIAAWAARKPEWITQFQREQIGYSLTPKQQHSAERLSDFAFKVDRAKEKFLRDQGVSFDPDADKKAAAAVAAYAKDLGISKYWTEAQQPEYVRIGKALDLSSRTKVWDVISGWATNLRKQITDAGYQVYGGGAMAKWAYAWFTNNVENIHDPALDKILTDMSEALGSDGNSLSSDETLLRLFFSVF